MTTALAILISIVLVPLLLALKWRSNGAAAFLSVALGVLLTGVVRGDVVDFVRGFTSFGSYASPQWVGLGLLVLPPLIALIVTKKSVSLAKQPLNFFPSLGAGLLAALFVVPLLPNNLTHAVQALTWWQKLTELQTLILLVGSCMSFVLFLVLRPSHHKEKEEKH